MLVPVYINSFITIYYNERKKKMKEYKYLNKLFSIMFYFGSPVNNPNWKVANHLAIYN